MGYFSRFFSIFTRCDLQIATWFCSIANKHAKWCSIYPVPWKYKMWCMVWSSSHDGSFCWNVWCWFSKAATQCGIFIPICRDLIHHKMCWKEDGKIQLLLLAKWMLIALNKTLFSLIRMKTLFTEVVLFAELHLEYLCTLSRCVFLHLDCNKMHYNGKI